MQLYMLCRFCGRKGGKPGQRPDNTCWLIFSNLRSNLRNSIAWAETVSKLIVKWLPHSLLDRTVEFFRILQIQMLFLVVVGIFKYLVCWSIFRLVFAIVWCWWWDSCSPTGSLHQRAPMLVLTFLPCVPPSTNKSIASDRFKTSTDS